MREISCRFAEERIRRGIAMRNAERARKNDAEALKGILVDARQLPSYWENLFGIQIIDPDGWDRTDRLCMMRPLTYQDFIRRYFISTARIVDKVKYAKCAHLFKF